MTLHSEHASTGFASARRSCVCGGGSRCPVPGGHLRSPNTGSLSAWAWVAWWGSRQTPPLADPDGWYETRQHPAVNAPPARNFPPEHNENCRGGQHRVRAGTAGEQVIEVHEQSDCGGNSRQSAKDQRNAYSDFAKCYELGKPGVVSTGQQALDEWSIPVVRNHRSWRRRQ